MIVPVFHALMEAPVLTKSIRIIVLVFFHSRVKTVRGNWTPAHPTVVKMVPAVLHQQTFSILPVTVVSVGQEDIVMKMWTSVPSVNLAGMAQLATIPMALIIVPVLWDTKAATV